jgi:arylsulfatase A-like enzyme
MIFAVPAGWGVAGLAGNLGQHVDIAPTLVGLCGVDRAAGWQGVDLLSGRRRRAYFLSYVTDEYLLGVRDGDWKYIVRGDFEQELLFDLSQDPQERHDVSRRRADVLASLRRGVVAWHRRQPPYVDSLRAE